MANFLYSDLLDEVLPNLAADPSQPVTKSAIKRTVIEFCRNSWVWRVFADAQSVQANNNEYDLEPPAGADIVTVLDVSYSGRPLIPQTADWLTRETPGWRTTTGAPKYFTQLDTDQVILAPLPASSESAALEMTLVLQPSQSSTGFPKWIANQYFYEIAEGATARLMLMPGYAWTDIQNGIARRSIFDAGIANARANAVAALGRATTRTTTQH